MTTAHRPALDGFRGLAILMVVMHHALAGKPDESAAALEWILRGAATALWMGVDCFFVLSGFLITGILLDTRGRPHALRNFLARRALRTLPLYYATVLVCLVVLPRLPGQDGLRALAAVRIWFWLHLSNFYNIVQMLTGYGPPVGWMSTFWSLAVEEHFYLFWAIALLAMRARLADAVIVLLVGTVGLRIALALFGFPDPVIYYCTFTRLDALLLGSALAAWSRRPAGLRSLVRPARALFVVAAVAMFVPSIGFAKSTFFGETFRYSLSALLFASLLVLTLDVEGSPGSLLGRFFSRPLLRSCGKYSYAMYVLNKPIIAALWLFVLRVELRAVLGRVGCLVAIYVAAVLLSLGGALVSWHLLEKRCLALKRYFETPAT